MQYQLSRNNIVTGPYTKETLIQHGILPTDLIKEEGQTEWHAPADFIDFKNAISSAKPKYKITADKEVIELKNESSKNTEQPETISNTPFKRTPSAAPKKKAITEVNSSEKTDNKKEISRNNIKAAATNPEPTSKIERVEYKRPVKAPAIKTQRKEDSTNAFKEIFAPLLIIGGIGLVVWIGYKKFFSTSSTSNNVVVQATPTDSLGKQQTTDTITPQEKPVIQKKRIVDSSAYYARRDSIRRAERAHKDSLAIVSAAKRRDSSKSNLQTIATTETIKKDVAPALQTKKETPVTTPKPATKKNGSSIGDYVSLSLNKIPNNEVKGIKLNLKNKSTQSLNIAVVNVSYLDSNGKVIRGETLQADNIRPGKTKSIAIPNDKNAANISYKISLISGDSVYLMGN